MTLKKLIREGEMIPKYYGIAYRNWDSLTAVCYPIPLNLIVGIWDRSILWLKHGHKLYENGYSKGYSEGYRGGREYAFNQWKQQAIRPEVEHLVKRGVDAMGDMFKLMREDEAKATGYFYKVIDEETKRISEFR